MSLFTPGAIMDNDKALTEKVMFLKFLFKRLSITRQAEFMRRRGIVLGTRKKDGRQTYLYMMNNLFAEILYENDNPRMSVEALVVLDGLNDLNAYMEKDIRSRASQDPSFKNYWM
jgi:hypothetical protein